ncbi:MAG: tRNA (adenosine(37)-N6)-dimethylallyltransferase MiaA [Pseudomonadota bacterium]
MPAVFLLGPTAAGKSALALAIAARLPCEIVSVDSGQVYRGMDIGTAKPSPAERAVVPHHLIDIREPDQPYSAGEFRDDARRLIADIEARGRIALLVGGTFLYFRALERGIAALPAADVATRRAIEDEAAARGWAALHAELATVDPIVAARVAPADRQRISRALEVFRLTGRPLSAWQAEVKTDLHRPALRLILAPADRQALYRAVDARFDAMLEAGLLDEAAALRRAGHDRDLPALRAVGYRQACAHLAGEIDFPTLVETGRTASRQYAKRQLTWLRGDSHGYWLDPGEAGLPERACRLVEEVVAAAG